MEPYRILFLCTGNSARSILAEFLLRHLAPGRFEVSSAGSRPRGEVHPLALEVLRTDFGIDPSSARSKSVAELSGEGFDFVVTLCDEAAEACPVWPGPAVSGHWGMDDPAAVAGSRDERLAAFRQAARLLERRLELLRDLPLGELEPAARRAALKAIAAPGG
jgi:arsenate reductase (thioredoxin)